MQNSLTVFHRNLYAVVIYHPPVIEVTWLYKPD